MVYFERHNVGGSMAQMSGAVRLKCRGVYCLFVRGVCSKCRGVKSKKTYKINCRGGAILYQMAQRNGISYLRWCRFFGNCQGGIPPIPDTETLILGTPVNVQTAGVQVAFATIEAPEPGQYFIVRRSGAMKSDAYVWDKAPHVSIGTVAPWMDVQANSNLQKIATKGQSQSQSDISAFADGTTFYASVNDSGDNATDNAHVYPYLIGFWKTITPCI